MQQFSGLLERTLSRVDRETVGESFVGTGLGDPRGVDDEGWTRGGGGRDGTFVGEVRRPSVLRDRGEREEVG